MNKLNICSMNKAFMIPKNTIEGNIYKNILESIYYYNYTSSQ